MIHLPCQEFEQHLSAAVPQEGILQIFELWLDTLPALYLKCKLNQLQKITVQKLTELCDQQH